MTIPQIPSPPDCTLGTLYTLVGECGQTDPNWEVVPDSGTGSGLRGQSTGCGGKSQRPCPLVVAIEKGWAPADVLKLAKILQEKVS